MNYKIKKFEKKHLKSCAELIRNTWNLHDGFKDLQDTLSVYIAYVCNCADWSSHLEVVVDEKDKVYGVMFGSIENPIFKESVKLHFNVFKTKIWIYFKWLCGGFGNRKVAWANFKLMSNIDKKGEKYAHLFDSEVNLLAVSKELRGKQFGYKLMINYINFCRENELKNSFLWTELSCTYSFYERFGYKLYDNFHSDYLTFGDYVKNNGMIYSMDIN